MDIVIVLDPGNLLSTLALTVSSVVFGTVILPAAVDWWKDR